MVENDCICSLTETCQDIETDTKPDLQGGYNHDAHLHRQICQKSNNPLFSVFHLVNHMPKRRLLDVTARLPVCDSISDHNLNSNSNLNPNGSSAASENNAAKAVFL